MTILTDQGSALPGDGRAGSGPSGSASGAASSADAPGASGSDATGTGVGECVPERCPSANLLGVAAPGCCQADGTCGAEIGFAGLSFCAPSGSTPPAPLEPLAPGGLPAPGAAPGSAEGVGAGGDPLAGLGPETIVSDAACPNQSLFGAQFAGCCDLTGVCGISTEVFASGGPFALPGFAIPLTCVAPGDVPLEGVPFLPQGVAAPVPCGGAGGPSSVDEGTGSIGGAPAGPGIVGGGGEGSPASSPLQALIAAIFDILVERLGLAPDVPDDASGDGVDSEPSDPGEDEDEEVGDDEDEEMGGDEGGDVGADAGVVAE